MTAAAITGGDVLIENIVPDHVKPITAKLRKLALKFQKNCQAFMLRQMVL